MISVRVNRVNVISDKDCDEFLGWYLWPTVPDVGELMNVDGQPYFVIERGWAAGAGTKKPPDKTVPDRELYCYLRVRG